MTYHSIHNEYELSIASQGKKPVGYHSFCSNWHKKAPYIDFIKPRTDLCMECDSLQKALNKVTIEKKQTREDEKILILKT